ncbi:MAG: hypothetical protein D6805_09860, partial [Planctomycetota bacterium]
PQLSRKKQPSSSSPTQAPDSQKKDSPKDTSTQNQKQPETSPTNQLTPAQRASKIQQLTARLKQGFKSLHNSDFSWILGNLVELMVPANGDKAKAEVEVGVQVAYSGVNGKVFLGFSLEAERGTDGRMSLKTSLSLNGAVGLKALIFELEAALQAFGYIATSGNSGTQCVQRMKYAIIRKLEGKKGKSRIVGILFGDQQAVKLFKQKVEQSMSTGEDDAIEVGWGMKGGAKAKVGNDKIASVEDEVNYEKTKSTKFIKNNKGKVEEEDLSTTDKSGKKIKQKHVSKTFKFSSNLTLFGNSLKVELSYARSGIEKSGFFNFFSGTSFELQKRNLDIQISSSGLLGQLSGPEWWIELGKTAIHTVEKFIAAISKKDGKAGTETLSNGVQQLISGYRSKINKIASVFQKKQQQAANLPQQTQQQQANQQKAKEGTGALLSGARDTLMSFLPNAKTGINLTLSSEQEKAGSSSKMGPWKDSLTVERVSSWEFQTEGLPVGVAPHVKVALESVSHILSITWGAGGGEAAVYGQNL